MRICNAKHSSFTGQLDRKSISESQFSSMSYATSKKLKDLEAKQFVIIFLLVFYLKGTPEIVSSRIRSSDTPVKSILTVHCVILLMVISSQKVPNGLHFPFTMQPWMVSGREVKFTP